MSARGLRDITVVGLGKLGSVFAATAASRGFRVHCVDVNPDVVAKINRGIAPVQEPELDDLFRRYRTSLGATTDASAVVPQSDITFIYVNTPSEPNGAFSTRYVEAAGMAVGRALRSRTGFHVVVLASTLLPGSTQATLQAALERSSGLACGVDFGLCYVPEFIALGTAVRDMLEPFMVVIGSTEGRSGDIVESFYRAYCLNESTPIHRMSITEAELVKVAVNSYLTLKIGYANFLAALSEQLVGTSVDVITSAIGRDPRIGGRFLKGGLSYGGPCFPRDNAALSYLASTLGVEHQFLKDVDVFNRLLPARQAARFLKHARPGETVGILGLAYKPRTSSVTESAALSVATLVHDAGHPLIVFDPMAMDSAGSLLPPTTKYAASVAEVLTVATAIMIMTPDPNFINIKPGDIPDRVPHVLVFDAWRIAQEQLGSAPNVRYIAVGQSNRAID